ncbi:uncharacterized protein (TIGR00369 family) [Alicyclobacillus sacchari]|uniref:Acyl-coenzyme A thioesterase THEM4 n=1 Tax=Alicyclobacillus sacchari TaxID=392010 RepID=A0A4V3HEX5_9BACL|nr:PaaI family thioesterase [Alicyclobacillus sacchari]TDY50631.1 uncharacterized protein (TIGR00369 family) [Alicyclobacillus sacchari]GMA55597.1 esterase [Alicyclobacillus sacchari]
MRSSMNPHGVDPLVLERSAVGTFSDYTGIRVIAIGETELEAELEIRPHHLNVAGILHGGVHATLLDSLMGLLVILQYPEDPVVTTNLNVHFTEPVSAGKLRAKAAFVHRGGRTMTVEGHVYSDDGRLCAFATGTFRVLNKSK